MQLPFDPPQVVIPRSHQHFDELARFRATLESPSREPQKPFYQTVAERCPAVFAAGAITAHVEAGDVFLWLDTTIHTRIGGTGAGPTAPTLTRAAVYVCMSPKANATAQTLRQREIAVDENFGNGHAAHHPIDASDDPRAHAGGAPQSWGGLAALNPSQRALVS